MPKKKVISLLEFLRTGVFGGISCGMSVNDFLLKFGQPDFKETFQVDPPVGCVGLGSLEVWFHEDTQVIYRIKLSHLSFQLFKKYGEFSRKAHPKDRVPYIPRVKIDPWILREGIDAKTIMLFLRSANLNYSHHKWGIGVDQIDLDSGVCLLCDPPAPDSDLPGLGQIEITDPKFPVRADQ